MPTAPPAPVSTNAGPRTIIDTPSSIRVTGSPVAGSMTGSPSSSSSYDVTRPVPEMVARRSSLTVSAWQLVQVFAPPVPRARAQIGATWFG